MDERLKKSTRQFKAVLFETIEIRFLFSRSRRGFVRESSASSSIGGCLRFRNTVTNGNRATCTLRGCPHTNITSRPTDRKANSGIKNSFQCLRPSGLIRMSGRSLDESERLRRVRKSDEKPNWSRTDKGLMVETRTVKSDLPVVIRAETNNSKEMSGIHSLIRHFRGHLGSPVI